MNRTVCFFGFSLLLTACATYTSETSKIRARLQEEKYADALEQSLESSVLQKSQNAVLQGMEVGMLQYLNGQFEVAARTWRGALQKSEDMYTLSLSREASTFLISDDVSDYPGETHEVLLLPVYSIMAYLAARQSEKALNETKRLIELIRTLEGNGEKPDPNRDRIAHYLAGFAYETKEDWDAALISYRASVGNDGFGPQAKGWAGFVSQEILRLASLRNRSDVLRPWGGQPVSTKTSSDSADVLVALELGAAPIKVPTEVLVPIGKTFVRVSFPVYKRISRVRGGGRVSIGNSAQSGQTALDIETLAEKSLENRRVKDLAKMTTRLVLKDQGARAAENALGPLGGLGVNVLAALTETADTRSWTTLPAVIQLARIRVSAGQPLHLKVEAGSVSRSTIIEVKPGEKRFVRFRLL